MPAAPAHPLLLYFRDTSYAQPRELITALTIPAGPHTRRSTYVKVRDRQSYAFAIASAAVALDLGADGVVRDARIGLGGVYYAPYRATAAEASLRGKRLDEASALAARAALQGAVTHGHNDYKPQLAGRTLVRALLQARDMPLTDGRVEIMATAQDPNPSAVPGGIGAAVRRVDGPLKVTGGARASRRARNHDVAKLGGTVRATQDLQRGRERLDHDHAAAIADVRHDGEIVAVVLAESYEAARDASQFVEVRVHHWTCEVRVPRIVGAFAAGRIVNPMTARSQLMGGMIWGISSALHEATEIDNRYARYTNDNLAEHLIPVNADVPNVELLFVPEVDTKVNPLGIKGVGELGSVGTNAAVCNAIYHGTGVRIRELPVRIESLL